MNGITVKGLIEKLKEFDGDLMVNLTWNDEKTVIDYGISDIVQDDDILDIFIDKK